jgi:stage II sporulation protein AB (anti-sigma F factor)
MSRLRLQLAAIPEEVPFARAAVDRLCERLEIQGELAERIRLAVTEACANCVLHAYGGDADTSTYVLDARLDKHALLVVVRDFGVGVLDAPPSEHPGLGFGLRLIEQAADHLTISSPPAGGTRVQMRFTLPGR